MSRYNYMNDNGRLRPTHCVIWERTHGQKIPPGYEVHHADGDGKNNSPENLILLTVSEHRALHSKLRAEGNDVIDLSDREIDTSRKRSKVWRATHKDQVRISKSKSSKKIRMEFHERQLAKEAEYRSLHRESINASQHKYVEKNRRWLNAKINLRNAIKRGDSEERLEQLRQVVAQERAAIDAVQ